MIQKLPPRSLLEDLEQRHDEVLEQIDELSQRIDLALLEATGGRVPTLANLPPEAAVKS